MKLNDPFSTLDELRVRIGAQEKTETYDQPLEKLSDVEIELSTTGIIVEKEDIELIGPYLTYKGEHFAILYICNSFSSSADLFSNDPTKRTPKFHLTWCKKLEDMEKENRFHRYVLSKRKSNLFRVEALEKDSELIRKHGKRHMMDDVQLFPCQYCLGKMEYKGFNYKQKRDEKQQQVLDFQVASFFEENYATFNVMKQIPITLAENAKSGGYTKDWYEISRRFREKNNWICSKCKVDMGDMKEGLHTHHINGNNKDNRESNLQVLCAYCHRDIDQHHKRMHIKPAIENYIKSHRPV